MYPENTLASQDNLVDQAAHSADQTIRATQNVANKALDSLAGSVQEIRQHAAPMLNRAVDQTSAMAHRGMDAVRDGSNQLREHAHRASDGTRNYIKEEPLKSMLYAAAAGAALMVLLRVAAGSYRRH
ncbi:MAG TPA: hypothetical protein VET87_19770 [Rubrivivax sp.]|nr:hypothetical protein [Rubrivivax sp.]